MKPLIQRTKRDCFATSIASILEVNRDIVPDFCAEADGKYFIDALNEWLRPYGFAFFDVEFRDEEGLSSMLKHLGYHTIAGDGGRGEMHSVVGCRGSIVHDPWPEGGGLLGTPLEWKYGLLISLDPSKMTFTLEEEHVRPT